MNDKYEKLAREVVSRMINSDRNIAITIAYALERVALEAMIKEAIVCEQASSSSLYASWVMLRIEELRAQLAELDATEMVKK